MHISFSQPAPIQCIPLSRPLFIYFHTSYTSYFIFILFSYFRLEQLVRTSPIAVRIVRWERQKNIDFEYCLITDFQNIKIHAKCRSSPPEVFYKKGDLRNFTNSQENTCARASLLIKLQTRPQGLQGLRPETLLKKRPWRRCFPVNFKKFLKKTFFTEHLQWVLLKVMISSKLIFNTQKLTMKFLYFLSLSLATHSKIIYPRVLIKTFQLSLDK